MDCNKEEAVRAKEIAEKKMEIKDFTVARRIVLKAQRLFPDLDNISQMQAVCDVHCAAELKVLGSDKDWYGILQVEPTSDEASIKKQYRKLALLLHPDKNNFPGAEAAFKMIGEAQRVLSDPARRNMYNLKRTAAQKPTSQKLSQPQTSRSHYTPKQHGVHVNHANTGPAQFTTMNPHQKKQQQQPQPGLSNEKQTFWTACPFCSIRYQYYRDIVNRALRCQSCTKPFIAYDLAAQGIPAGPNNQSFPQKKQASSKDGQKIGSQSTMWNFSSTTAQQQNNGSTEKVSQSFTMTGRTSFGGESATATVKQDVNVRNGGGTVGKEIPREHKPSTNRKRRRKSEEEASESCDTESSTDIEGGDHVTRFSNGDNRRRSSRQKQQVQYKEGLSDDEDIVGSSKRKLSASNDTKEWSAASMKGDGGRTDEKFVFASYFKEDMVKNEKNSTTPQDSLPNGNKEADVCKNNGKEAAVVPPHKEVAEDAITSKPRVLEVPDPDFFDFDRVKKEEHFAADQIWAIYDDLDGMPRFYARIRKVRSPGFSIQITWLDPFSDDQDEINWINKGLPVACGKFKHEQTDDVEDIGMFSHKVDWEKGATRGSFSIYPRKGEIWALFKNWDIKWSLDPDNHRNYEYEFVEVLSDYSKESGIRVAYLIKIKGFVSLFKPTTNNGMVFFQIPPNEIFRFGHRVPSFVTSGTEREGVPKGYFELDPASLPGKIEEIPDTVDLEVNVESIYKTNVSSKLTADMNYSPKKRKNHPEARNTLNGGDSKSIKGSPMLSNGRNRKQGEENVGHFVENISSGSDDVKNRDDSKVKGNGAHQSSPSTSNLDPSELLESIFYNFDNDKSRDKFLPGQIWALYCDLDALPKFYAHIRSVEFSPSFKLRTTWLESSALPQNVIQWHDKEMPICSGRFTIGDSCDFNHTAAFSHQLRGVSITRKNKFDIYPRKGEVWALYKNFDPKLSCSSLHKCEYEVVEVLEEKVQTIKVMVLQKVATYETIFKGESNGGKNFTMEIPRVELLKFSHQIPAFRLTGEINGKLRGCFELDPKALPLYFLSSKSN